jgi:hypothetical protein
LVGVLLILLVLLVRLVLYVSAGVLLFGQQKKTVRNHNWFLVLEILTHFSTGVLFSLYTDDRSYANNNFVVVATQHYLGQYWSVLHDFTFDSRV